MSVVQKRREETRVRHSSNCNATRQNARTCQIIVEISEEVDSK